MANRAQQPRHPRNFSQPRAYLPVPGQPLSNRPRRSWPGAQPGQQQGGSRGGHPQGEIWLQSRPRLGHREVKLRVFGQAGIQQLRPGPHDSNKWNAPAALAACEEYAAALVDASVIRNNRGDMLFFLRGHSLRAARCTDPDPRQEGPGALVVVPPRQNVASSQLQVVPQAALAASNFLARGNFVATGNFLVEGNVFTGNNFVAMGNFFLGGNLSATGVPPPSEQSTVSSGENMPQLPGPQGMVLQDINQPQPATSQPASMADLEQDSRPICNGTTGDPIDLFDSSDEVRYNQDGNPLTLRDLVKVSQKEDRSDRQFVPWPLPPSRRVAEQVDELQQHPRI